MQLDLSLRSLFVHGGAILLLLLLASLWSWVLIVARCLAYRRAEAGSDRLSARGAKLARAGQVAEARELAQAEEGSVGRLLQAGLAHASRERATLDEALSRKQSEEL